MKNTKIKISFKGKNQLPELMIIKEFYVNGELDFAKVLFQIWINEKKCNKKLVCCRCQHPVLKSEVKGYKYQCLECDEDLYNFEVEELKI